MKLKRLLVLLTLIFLLSISVLGELTEYQRGVANGLKIGLLMGEYYGRGQYVVDYANQYNAYLDNYNQFLWSSFGGNQTIMDEFLMQSLAASGTKKVTKSNTSMSMSTTSNTQTTNDIF
jgi:hypothetical protein